MRSRPGGGIAVRVAVGAGLALTEVDEGGAIALVEESLVGVETVTDRLEEAERDTDGGMDCWLRVFFVIEGLDLDVADRIPTRSSHI